jgi:hypothetical protein
VLSRALWLTGLLCGGAAVVVGGLALSGAGLVAVGVAGVLAACMAAGIAREAPGSHFRSTVEAAVTAGAGTVIGLLGLAGIAAVAGGAIATLTVVVGILVTLAVRVARGRRAARPVPSTTATPLVALPPTDGRPVVVLTTPELGQEWLRTTAVLAGPLDPVQRAAVVLRRQEALDELECRDPAGFTRWLACGATPCSDPAEFVRGGRVPGRRLWGDPAADPDAA